MSVATGFVEAVETKANIRAGGTQKSSQPESQSSSAPTNHNSNSNQPQPSTSFTPPPDDEPISANSSVAVVKAPELVLVPSTKDLRLEITTVRLNLAIGLLPEVTKTFKT